MKLNLEVLNRVKQANAQIVVVTKYLNPEDTKTILAQTDGESVVFGLGENRTEVLAQKKLPREKVHYIGRIQSRKIPEIIEHCSTIHSLASVKHARILNDKISLVCSPLGGALERENKLNVFVQVNVSKDPAKEGILGEDLESFLEAMDEFKHLKIIGLSSMGWAAISTKDEVRRKKDEFAQLINLRDLYLPSGKTSAGTSRDYHLALEAGIDIVRVGKGCFIGL